MGADPPLHYAAPFVRMGTSAAGLGEAVPQHVDGGAGPIEVERAVESGRNGCLGGRGDRWREHRVFRHEGYPFDGCICVQLGLHIDLVSPLRGKASQKVTSAPRVELVEMNRVLSPGNWINRDEFEPVVWCPGPWGPVGDALEAAGVAMLDHTLDVNGSAAVPVLAGRRASDLHLRAREYTVWLQCRCPQLGHGCHRCELRRLR